MFHVKHILYTSRYSDALIPRLNRRFLPVFPFRFMRLPGGLLLRVRGYGFDRTFDIDVARNRPSSFLDYSSNRHGPIGLHHKAGWLFLDGPWRMHRGPVWIPFGANAGYTCCPCADFPIASQITLNCPEGIINLTVYTGNNTCRWTSVNTLVSANAVFPCNPCSQEPYNQGDCVGPLEPPWCGCYCGLDPLTTNIPIIYYVSCAGPNTLTVGRAWFVDNMAFPPTTVYYDLGFHTVGCDFPNGSSNTIDLSGGPPLNWGGILNPSPANLLPDPDPAGPTSVQG